MQLSKKAIQEENEALKRENDDLRSDVATLKRDRESLKDTTQQQDKRIDGLRVAADEAKKELDRSKRQSAEYKQEIDSLNDTKVVLDRLLSILRSPHNDYQKVVDELNDMLHKERVRANALELELRNIQFDIQHNKFLDGKVQAYEAMFRVNPVKTAWGDFEQSDVPEIRATP